MYLKIMYLIQDTRTKSNSKQCFVDFSTEKDYKCNKNTNIHTLISFLDHKASCQEHISIFYIYKNTFWFIKYTKNKNLLEN